MARVKYGTIVTEIRGKVGGNVFQKCGSQFSMRVNTSKRVNNNNNSFKSRNDFAFLASTWAGMSAMERATFSTHAPSYPTLDKWGNPVVLSAYQLFLYINRPLRLVSEIPIRECSAYYNFTPSTDGWTLANTSSEEFIITVVDEIPWDFNILVYASQLLPANSYRVPDQIKFITSATEIGPTDWNIYNYLISYWNRIPQDGESFYILVRSVNNLTGIVNDEWDDIATWTS